LAPDAVRLSRTGASADINSDHRTLPGGIVTGSRHRLAPSLAAAGLLAAALTIGSPAPATGAPGGITITQDVEYSHPGGVSLRLDAFVPGGEGPFPGLIALHGGGWVLGDKREWDNNCRSLALQGFACFSIDYRLAPDHPYPASVQDALAAVEWVRNHADEYKVDPTRLGAIGSSAGAHLAAMIGYTGKGSTDTGTRVRVIVLWSPVTDIPALLPEGANANRAISNVHDFMGCDLTQCTAREREASPVTYVDSTDPPTMIANSTDEQIPLSQAKELSGVLKDANVPRELHVIEGKNHGARLKNQFPKDAGGQTVWDLSVAFLQKWVNTDTGSVPGSPTPSTPVPTGSFDAGPPSNKGDATLFIIVAGVGVVVVLGLVGVPLLRRRRFR
jgi:acetyl esterase/lipase